MVAGRSAHSRQHSLALHHCRTLITTVGGWPAPGRRAAQRCTRCAGSSRCRPARSEPVRPGRVGPQCGRAWSSRWSSGRRWAALPVGVQAAIGALQTAFADRPGPYRLRVARMLVTALVAGLTAGLAAGLGNNLLASAVLLAVLAFTAGLLLSVGPSAAQVGIAATACALVLGHIPERPLAALCTGLLVLAGGAVQTVLAIAAWPLGRHRPERQALAGAVPASLPGWPRNPIDAGTSPPLGTAIADTECGAARCRSRPRAERRGLPGAAGRGGAGPAGHPGAVRLRRPARPGRRSRPPRRCCGPS